MSSAYTCKNGSTAPACNSDYSGMVYASTTQLQDNHVNWRCDSLNPSSLSPDSCNDFGYDDLDRMTLMEAYGVSKYTYDYDRYGNRWAQTPQNGVSGPSPSVSFDLVTNRISGASYDNAGNLKSDGVHSYVYDAEGNVTGVDGSTTAYYNALNQRVRTVASNGTIEYVFTADGKIQSAWNTSGQPIWNTYYWGSQRIAMDAGGAFHFFHQDWHGSEKVQTGYNQSVETTNFWLPFGDGASSSSNSLNYSELDNDADSQTHHATFRQYSAAQGRWMSPDPYSGATTSAIRKALTATATSATGR